MKYVNQTIEDIQNQYKVGIDYSKGKDLTAITLLGNQAEIAISALEKQLEKKIDFLDSRVNARFENIYKCPTCSCYHLKVRDQYCKHCGQKIGW